MRTTGTSASSAVIPDTLEQLATKYADIRVMGRGKYPYAMPFENRRTVYLMRNRRPSAPFHWEDERFTTDPRGSKAPFWYSPCNDLSDCFGNRGG
jgi:hypothetical protein